MPSTRSLVRWAVMRAVHSRHLARRRAQCYRAYADLGYPIGHPHEVTSVPPKAVALGLLRVRRYWRPWVVAESVLALLVGPGAIMPLSLPLLYLVAAWLTEALWVSGIDVTDEAKVQSIVSALDRELRSLWVCHKAQTRSPYRHLALGFGLEGRWASEVVERARVTVYMASTACNRSAAMSSTDSMPTAMRTVPSVMPMARRVSSL